MRPPRASWMGTAFERSRSQTVYKVSLAVTIVDEGAGSVTF